MKSKDCFTPRNTINTKTSVLMSDRKFINYWKRFQGLVIVAFFGLFISFSVYELANSQNKSVLEDENLYSQIVSAQEKSDVSLVSIEFLNIPIHEALELLAKKVNVGFSYNPEIIPNKQINLSMTDVPPHEIIYKLLEGTNLEPVLPPSKDVIVIREKEKDAETEIYQETVRGTVVDAESGETLPGVNIVVQGTTTGTVTSENGEYELTVPSLNDVLIFTYVGYEQEEVSINGRTEINIELEPFTIAGDELVVTAFGISRERKSLTYSTQGVNAEQVSQTRELNVVNSLSGKVAGISISDGGRGVGSPSKVLLRGNRSFNSSDEPLYVIDGVPVRSGISDLSPNNIESIEVLKGPNAAALYGSTAQNGAIVVTTKKGEADNISVSLNNNVMITTPNILHDFQNEYGQGLEGEYNRRTFSSWGPRMEGQMVDHWSPDPSLAGEQIPYSPQPNNISDFFQNGYSASTNLTANVGGENTQTVFGYTFTDAKGIVPNNTLERHNVDIRVTSQLSDKLSLDSKLSYLKEDTDYRISFSGTTGASAMMYRIPRSLRTVDISNYEYADQDGNIRQNTWLPGFDRSLNPYWSANNIRERVPRNRVIGLASLTYDFNEKLSLMVRASYDQDNSFFEEIVHNDTGTTRSNGFYGVSESISSQFNGDFLGTYNSNLSNDWSFNASAGGSIKQQRNRDLSSNTGSALTIPNFFSISNTQNVQSDFNAGSPVDIWSLYGFTTIGWKDVIYLDLTGRNDWSSTLPSESRSFFYPSVGLSTILSDLISTFPDFIEYTQIRLSWAKVGNSPGPFNTQRFVNFISGGNNGFMRLSNTLPNENLLPEETESYELGVNIRFLEGRIGLDFTAYQTNTRNQLFSLALPVASGASAFFTNGGDVQNQGIEMMLNTTPIQARDFNWDLNFNFASNRNEVIKIADERDIIFLGGPGGRISDFGIQEGKPFGQIYSRGFERDDQGRVLIDSDGLPLTTSGVTVAVANPNPDWRGAIVSSILYKNINLSFVIDHQQGGSIVSRTNSLLDAEGHTKKSLDGREGGLIFGENLFANETAVMATDGSPNTTEIDAETFWSAMGGHQNPIGEPFVQDATYTKLRELIVGYTIPQSIIENLPISNLQISLVGRNLLFIYRASDNIDPDILQGTGKGAPGVSAFPPPTGRRFGFNVNIDF